MESNVFVLQLDYNQLPYLASRQEVEALKLLVPQPKFNWSSLYMDRSTSCNSHFYAGMDLLRAGHDIMQN